MFWTYVFCISLDNNSPQFIAISYSFLAHILRVPLRCILSIISCIFSAFLRKRYCLASDPFMPISMNRIAVYFVALICAFFPTLFPIASATEANPGKAPHATVKTPHVAAELISQQTAIVPGQPIEVALRFQIIEHWHTYWQNPGDSGLPTKLKWHLPSGFSASAIQWPYPKKLPLGPLMNFGYEGETLHLVTIQTPKNLNAGDKITLSAKADWLVCADVCIPEEGDVSVTLPVSLDAAASRIDPRWANAFATAQAALPVAFNTRTNWKASAKLAPQGLQIDLTPPTPPQGETLDLQELTFYPYQGELIENAGKQVLTRVSEGFRLFVPVIDPLAADLKTVNGVLVSSNGWGGGLGSARANKAVEIAAPVSYAKIENPSIGGAPKPKIPEEPLSAVSLLATLGAALLGGLILNLMPCVFPVLGIKVMGFVQNAHGDGGALRRQGLAFFVGVVLSFLVLAGLMLALRAAGQSIGWGFQLQEPGFIVVLALVFFIMALNLSGVFEIGTSLQSAAGQAELNAQKNPLVGAFASGVLATVVATPCMAPGLGASVGFTLSQSTSIALLVFLAIAVGLAAPVLLLSFVPAWLKFLPKPGAWMETFKECMAFPLYATVVWLAWVLGSQTGNDGVAKLLLALVTIAFAAWAYGRWQVKKPMLAMILAVVGLAAGAVLSWPADELQTDAQGKKIDDGWVAFSPAKITELRAAGKPVFVDFTATWCITCQVNKRVALNKAEVVKRFQELGIVRLKADWTVKDPVITAALAEFGRNGVPLYVFYPKNGEPQVLPEVLTPSVVLAAIGAAK